MDTAVEKSEEDNHPTGFIWAYKPHPMCIPHIVDNIQSYLTVLDLKSCRLVNSQYNEIGCRNLARKEVVTFNKFAHLSSYINFIPISSQLFPNFSQQCKYPSPSHTTTTESAKDDNNEFQILNLQNTPKRPPPCNNDYAHTSFHFNFHPASDSEKGEVDKVQHFFNTFGSNIKELRYTTDLIPYNFPKELAHIGDIWKNRMENLETLSLEIKWGIPSCLYDREEGQVTLPNVRKLILDILVSDREADRAEKFLRQLLGSTPNVEEITIPGNKKFFDDYVNVVLGRIILSSQLQRITSLNFCLALDDLDTRALADKKLPLKSLILDFAEMPYYPLPHDENNNDDGNGAPNFQNETLIRSLQALFLNTSSTLQDLHLCFPYNPAHSLHRFTFLEPMKLSHFALGGFMGSKKILDQLPALRKLDLWNVHFHDFDYDYDKPEEGCNSSEDGKGGVGRYVPNQYLGITTVIS